MLNSCETRVWFVVELCEGIQASRVRLRGRFVGGVGGGEQLGWDVWEGGEDLGELYGQEAVSIGWGWWYGR